MMETVREIRIELLTQDAFALFGDVLETENRESFFINKGNDKRFHGLSRIDIGDPSPALISFFHVKPTSFPLKINMLERHPLSSQAMFPIAEKPFLIVVAPRGDKIDPAHIRAFLTNGKQGVNYHKGTWHCPTLALHCITEMLVVDRGGHDNCEEQYLDLSLLIKTI